MAKIKVLVTTPRLNKSGGVSSLLQLLALNNEDDIRYLTIQSDGNYLSRIIFLLFLPFRFMAGLSSVNVVHLNPSMNANSFWRDGFLMFLSLIFRKRVIVYWHGWDEAFYNSIELSQIKKWILLSVFGHAEKIVVLANSFRMGLERLGVSSNVIHVLHNAAEPIDKLDWKNSNREVLRVLFMSRIESGKGLELALKTIAILQDQFTVRLDIAGDGSELSNMRVLSKELKLKNVHFHGHVQGLIKSSLWSQAHLLFQPSSSEGMPLSVLEAMFNGVLIAAKPVGGIPDCVSSDFSILSGSNDEREWAFFISSFWQDQQRWNEAIDIQYKWVIENAAPSVLRSKLINFYQG